MLTPSSPGQAEFDRLPLGADHRSDRTRSGLGADFLRLCRLGYEVHRLGDWQVANRPAEVAETLRAVLAR